MGRRFGSKLNRRGRRIMTATTPEMKTAPAAGTAEATSPQKGTKLNTSTVTLADSEQAVRDRLRAQKRELEPVALAVAPHWADPAEIEVCDVDTDSRMIEVRYESRDFAPANNPIKALLKISSYVHMTMAGVPVTVEAPQMDVYVTESYNAANVTANDVRALAEGMNALAAEFDRITAAEATA